MFGLTITTTTNPKPVLDAARKAELRSLQQATFRLFAAERESIKDIDGSSPPGTPPHTHTAGVFKQGKRKGQRKLGFLPRSFAYSVDASKLESVTGPRASVVGLSAEAHEKGLEFHGDRYPERSFAQPALEKILPDFAQSFASSF